MMLRLFLADVELHVCLFCVVFVLMLCWLGVNDRNDVVVVLLLLCLFRIGLALLL